MKPSPSQRKLVAVDIDEVLSETRSLFDIIASEHGVSVIPTHAYHPRNWYDASDEVIRSIQSAADVRFHEAAPVAMAPQAVAELRQWYDLIAVTGRNERLHGAATQRFLEQWYPGCFSEVLYVDHEGADNPKSEVLHRTGACCIIEDLPKYVSEVAAAGVPVVYLNRRLPWQVEVEHPLVLTVRHWNEVHLAVALAIELGTSLVPR